MTVDDDRVFGFAVSKLGLQDFSGSFSFSTTPDTSPAKNEAARAMPLPTASTKIAKARSLPTRLAGGGSAGRSSAAAGGMDFSGSFAFNTTPDIAEEAVYHDFDIILAGSLARFRQRAGHRATSICVPRWSALSGGDSDCAVTVLCCVLCLYAVSVCCASVLCRCAVSVCCVGVLCRCAASVLLDVAR